MRILCQVFKALITVRAIDGASSNAGTMGCGPGGGRGELCSLRGRNAKHGHGSPFQRKLPDHPGFLSPLLPPERVQLEGSGFLPC